MIIRNSRTVFFALLLILVLSGCSSVRNISVQREMQERASVVVYAEKFVGIPYRYGGSTPQGFDCSGYVNYVFRNYGYNLPRSTSELIKTGKKISKKDAMPGDLIFFTGNNKRSKTAGHVGIITSVQGDKIYFIHASTSSGIRVDSNEQEYYRSRFLQIRKVLT